MFVKKSLLSHHYKYIHLMFGPDIGGTFFPRLVAMFNDIHNKFDVSEHCFVTVYKSTYERIQHYPNIYYFDNTNKKGPTAQIVNSLASCGDWIFLHCGLIPKETVKIKRNYLKKIIWRTWGHDTQLNYWKGHEIRNIMKKLFLAPIWVRTVRKFKAIGVANLVDEIGIRDVFGEVHTYSLNYPHKTYNVIESDFDDSDCFRIMIGHAGFINDHHEIILKILEKWKNENIKIYLPVAYGDKTYVDLLKKVCSNWGGDKVCFIQNMMDYGHYCGFISTWM